MANTSFSIVVSTPETVAQMQRFILASSNARDEALALANYFTRLASGQASATFTVQTAATAPVRASNTLTLTYASIANNDTTVVCGVTLTCVTGTPTGAQFKKETDATVTAANLVALVNSLATTNIYVFASNVAGVVTLTAQSPGVNGNFLTLVGSTGIVRASALFTGGTGGSQSTPISYNRG